MAPTTLTPRRAKREDRLSVTFPFGSFASYALDSQALLVYATKLG